MGISALREQEGEGDTPPPVRGERFLDHAETLVSVEEDVGAGEDPNMLGNGSGLHAKEDQRARTGVSRCDFRHHMPRALCQNFARAGLAPIPAIWRNRERLWPDDLAPDAARQPKTVAANAPKAGLVVIRRAQPGPRYLDNAL